MIVCILVLLFFHALTPGIAWDDDVYHLNLPKLYLKNHGFLRIPYNIYSNWPMNFEMLYTLGMSVQDHVTSKLIHYGFGILYFILWSLSSQQMRFLIQALPFFSIVSAFGVIRRRSLLKLSLPFTGSSTAALPHRRD
ncbi:MAG: hypothetical protein AB1756_08175 [Acidobacteriota bacterium]